MKREERGGVNLTSGETGIYGPEERYSDEFYMERMGKSSVFDVFDPPGAPVRNVTCFE